MTITAGTIFLCSVQECLPTDTDLLLATYKGESHLTCDIRNRRLTLVRFRTIMSMKSD
mgnify:CR=1